VSISGATGVLVNITGGQDLTLGEVHQINEIIHDAVGDEAEIIFGAVHEPAMQGEIRVTVIATGFDRQLGTAGLAPEPAAAAPMKGAPVIPFPSQRAQAQPVTHPARPTPAATTAQQRSEIPRFSPPTSRPAERPSSALPDDMEIPTFIRRQMD
jgi:cell division protein FtsZ